MVPVFKNLSKDHIWGVRAQAVEILPSICQLAPEEIKSKDLLDIFKKFTTDTSKWVKQAATKVLGPFLVAYENLQDSRVLLKFYVEMVADI